MNKKQLVALIKMTFIPLILILAGAFAVAYFFPVHASHFSFNAIHPLFYILTLLASMVFLYELMHFFQNYKKPIRILLLLLQIIMIAAIASFLFLVFIYGIFVVVSPSYLGTVDCIGSLISLTELLVGMTSIDEILGFLAVVMNLINMAFLVAIAFLFGDRFINRILGFFAGVVAVFLLNAAYLYLNDLFYRGLLMLDLNVIRKYFDVITALIYLPIFIGIVINEESRRARIIASKRRREG